MKNHFRLLGGIATALVVALPSVAQAAHDLHIYKVESDVVLKSDDQTVSLACKAGDYALDGMWRIEHGDQDDDDITLTSIGRAVDVFEAAPSVSANAYKFRFVKNVLGRAQVKVFATCLDNETDSEGGHSHTLTFTEATGYTRASPKTLQKPSWPVAIGSHADPAVCPAKTAVSGTGFRITPTLDAEGDPTAYIARVLSSRPTDEVKASGSTTAVRGWSWKFDLASDDAAKVELFASCLSRKVPEAGGETHKLIYRMATAEASSAAGKATTERINCGAHYKAVVAGFDLGASAATVADPFDGALRMNPWYLGMTPQPKSRDYKFLNIAGAAKDIDLAAICLNYRTT